MIRFYCNDVILALPSSSISRICSDRYDVVSMIKWKWVKVVRNENTNRSKRRVRQHHRRRRLTLLLSILCHQPSLLLLLLEHRGYLDIDDVSKLDPMCSLDSDINISMHIHHHWRRFVSQFASSLSRFCLNGTLSAPNHLSIGRNVDNYSELWSDIIGRICVWHRRMLNCF
jgi:hypothetical protein